MRLEKNINAMMESSTQTDNVLLSPAQRPFPPNKNEHDASPASRTKSR